MTTESTSHTCPYCKENIKPDAIKCKHCGSKVASSLPSHNGTCPYCKESINKEAIKCKHCKSSLEANSNCDCDKNNDDKGVVTSLIRSILEPHGPYQDCYLDCSFDHPTDSLDQNLCFKRCDRRHGNSLMLLSQLAGLARR